MKTTLHYIFTFFLSLTFIKCSSQKESVNGNWGGGVNWSYPNATHNLKGPIKRIIQYKVINKTGIPEERTYKAFFSWGEHDHGYLLAGIQLRYDRKGLVPGKLNTYSNDTITNNFEYDSLVPKFLKSIDTTVSPFPDNWLRDTIDIQEKYSYKPKYSYKHYRGGICIS